MHIKRFDSITRKISSHTSFPGKLDLKPFCPSNVDNNILGETNYELFGLTVHHGRIDSGHYIAYVNRDNDWY